jgi:hypothetical protein
VSKNKLKFLIFVVSFLALFLIDNKQIKAIDYNVSVESVSNLVYGNKLKDGTITGESEIEGEFSFYDSDLVLDNVGTKSIDIIFTPQDLNNYSSKRITVDVEVSRKKISVVFSTPIYKQYDGNSSISLPEYSYVGIIDNEIEVVGTLTATLAATYVSEDIPLVLSGVTLVGDKANCYYIDLEEHTARIYPSRLEKGGENATYIDLDKDVYVDISYSLKVEKINEAVSVNKKYTSFLRYNYEVYSHNNVKLSVDSKFKIMMKIDKEVMEKERLKVFELTSSGEYKELEYFYQEGVIYFSIDSDSSLVLTTRDIEYELIVLFSGVLLFSLVFIVIYRFKNSRIKEYKSY